MTAFVHIEPGQWVLSYVECFGPYPLDGNLVEALERLVWGGSGWDCLHRPQQQFDVHRVERVMPKTYKPVGQKRWFRNQVIAASGSEAGLLALRDKLFAIGFAADRAIEEETARLIADFAAKTRADALTKVHAALPHIFGRAA